MGLHFTMVYFSGYNLFLSMLLLPFVFHLALSSAKDFFLKKEHTLAKPYTGMWDFTGTTMVTSNYVRLTSNRQSQAGSIWNTVPVSIRDWEVHIHFKVHGSDGLLFGDGLAFWYTEKNLQPGPVFGNMNEFRGMAIFFDTYSNHNGPHNHEHPYISAMINNGSQSYDHDRDGTHTELAGCTSFFRNRNHDTVVAVRYAKNRVTISTDVEGKGTWKDCFSVDGVYLPTGYYFGASAATGDLADNHDLYSIKVYELDVDRTAEDLAADYSKVEPRALHHSPEREHAKDPNSGYVSGRMSGLKLLVVIIIALIGLGVCGIVGFLLYVRQEDQRKRFY